MTEKEKIKEYLDYKGISKNKFYSQTGLSIGFLDSGKSIGVDKARIIINTYPDLNISWLVLGKGSMINDSNYKYKQSIGSECCAIIKEITFPLVGIQAIGGFGSGEFAIGERDVKDTYVIPKFKGRKIDFMIEVSGSSMYPKYNSGDVVACRIIKESRFIQWNKVHVIATKEQGILIKRIDISDRPEHIRAISDNKDYRPFDIPQDEVTGLALVVGVIRLE